MYESVVVAMFPDGDAASAAAARLARVASGRTPIATVRLAAGSSDSEAAVALVVDPEHPTLLVEGFLVGSLLKTQDDSEGTVPLVEALGRVAVPRSSALRYTRALHEGAALILLRTPDASVERACRSLAEVGGRAPSVHHFRTDRPRFAGARSQEA